MSENYHYLHKLYLHIYFYINYHIFISFSDALPLKPIILVLVVSVVTNYYLLANYVLVSWQLYKKTKRGSSQFFHCGWCWRIKVNFNRKLFSYWYNFSIFLIAWLRKSTLFHTWNSADLQLFNIFTIFRFLQLFTWLVWK